MKAKRYYKKYKTDSRIGKWLKYYFKKRTCRRRITIPEDVHPVCGNYQIEKK